MKKLLCLLIVALYAGCQFSFGQDFVLPLYNNKIPNSINTGQREKIEKSDITLISNVQNPDIAVYLPSKRFATGQAVVIVPEEVTGYWLMILKEQTSPGISIQLVLQASC